MVFVVLGILTCLWGIPPALAENRTPQPATAPIPLFNDNSAKAETQPMRRAKQTIFEKSLHQFIAPSLLTQAQKWNQVPIHGQGNPLRASLTATNQQKGALVQVKLLGLEMPEHEGVVVREIFGNPALWHQFELYALAKDYVIYQGSYSGSLKALASQVKAVQSPFFRIRSVGWKDNMLELKVQWQNPLTPLLKYQPIALVQQWVRRKKLLVPRRRVPPNHVNKIFELPRSIAVYDYLRSRGDSTFFQVDWAKPAQTVQGIWSEIARTNLSPMLSIYDAQRNLVARHNPKKGLIRFKYRLPQGQSRFYIRISDRIGHIAGEAGSFLSVHYALQVSPAK